MRVKCALLLTSLYFLIGSASIAEAATRSYQVDLIVFKRTTSSDINQEAPTLPAHSHLKIALTRLKASPEYHVLFADSFITELTTGVKKTVSLPHGLVTLVLGYYIDMYLYLDIPPDHVEQKWKINGQKLFYIDSADHGILLFLSPTGPTHHDN